MRIEEKIHRVSVMRYDLIFKQIRGCRSRMSFLHFYSDDDIQPAIRTELKESYVEYNLYVKRARAAR